MPRFFVFFFFNDTATTEIYPLSLHDALPISAASANDNSGQSSASDAAAIAAAISQANRSEEHTSELQSHSDLVCRLLLEKKKKKKKTHTDATQHDCVRDKPATPLPQPVQTRY